MPHRNPVPTYARRILGELDLIIVDVGAADGLPPHLRPLEPVATVCFFEPREPAAEELRKRFAQEGNGRKLVFPFALAGSDGERTLYTTNTPTGSSFLKPGSRFCNDFCDPDYFYPMREVNVRTRRLEHVMGDAGVRRIDAIKIDVQGTELHVLEGAGKELLSELVSTEMEIGFPGAYIDQPNYPQINAFMEAAGFDLYDMRLASHHRPYRGDWSYYARQVFDVTDQSRSLTRRLTEVDGLYFRRPDFLIDKRDASSLRRLMVCMCAYGFFVEALHVTNLAHNASMFSEPERTDLVAAITDWHRSNRDVIADSVWFAKLTDFLNRKSRGLQRRLLGKQFARWLP